MRALNGARAQKRVIKAAGRPSFAVLTKGGGIKKVLLGIITVKKGCEKNQQFSRKIFKKIVK